MACPVPSVDSLALACQVRSGQVWVCVGEPRAAFRNREGRVTRREREGSAGNTERTDICHIKLHFRRQGDGRSIGPSTLFLLLTQHTQSVILFAHSRNLQQCLGSSLFLPRKQANRESV